MGHRSWRLASADDARARRLLYRLGKTNYRDRLLLAWARAGRDRDAPRWCELAQLPERFTPPKFPLREADLIARGVAEVPLLVLVLSLAVDAWLAAVFPLDRPARGAGAGRAAARSRRGGRA